MIGLALEGGGVRGSYQAGVYMAMLECNIKIDGVCGTSIGALNGAMIASGLGHKLPAIWRSLKVGKVFCFSDSFVEARINKKRDFNFFKQTFLGILDVLKNKGIELSEFKKFIDTHLDVDLLYNSPIDYGLCTVRFKDLKPMYLFKEDMAKDKIKEYILASAYLPIFKMEKIIDDSYYLDGGFYDVSPVSMLLDKGYKQVYLVKLRGYGIHRPYDKNKVIVIESKRKLGGVLDFDPNRIDENINMGYYDGLRVFKNYDGEKYVFKSKSESFYRFLNRKVSKKLYRRVKSFFKAKNYKETTIRAVEYILERIEYNYYDVYKPYKVIKYIKKNYNNNHFIYSYVKKLKHFI